MTVDDLYDYDEVRSARSPTLYVARVHQPTLVLGGHQPSAVLERTQSASVALRRRRGGGGLVLLRPDDLWLDWWIPFDDPRWRSDIRASSLLVGNWWAETLRTLTAEVVRVFDGPLEGEAAHRVVCFAGRGPGEVFVADRKAVGVTQWRVREGVFVSTVLHAGPTSDVLAYLAEVPPGLSDSLDHQTLASLDVSNREHVIESLAAACAPWVMRTHSLD